MTTVNLIETLDDCSADLAFLELMGDEYSEYPNASLEKTYS
jgi:hypothetical protein